MFKISNLVFIFGLFLLFFSIINLLSASESTPYLVRAETISGISSICLMSVGILWNDVSPKKANRAKLVGKEGFDLGDGLSDIKKNELAWGSQLILTATAASTVLIYWDQSIILRRGLISNYDFVPGLICKKAMKEQRLISLVNTTLFPGSDEFDNVLENLPAVLVYPISNRGFIIVGGWSKRSFTKSDEKWITGWSDKISDMLSN